MNTYKSLLRVVFLLSLLFLTACDYQKPVAINSDATVRVQQSVEIPLSATFFALHNVITYNIIEPPENGSIKQNGGVITYTPNHGFTGVDKLKFTVSDVFFVSEPATVSINVSGNAAPVPVITEATKVAKIGSIVNLNASQSYDIENDAMSFNWKLIEKPSGSNTALDVNNDSAKLAIDVKGQYKLQLTVADELGESLPEVVTIYSSLYDFNLIDHVVTDAAYDDVNNHLITVSNDPAKINRINLNSGEQQSLNLSQATTALGLSLDNKQAVVGHTGSVSLIDLDKLNLIKNYTVDATVFDVETSNGFIYVMPKTDQWEHIRSINISTGEVSKTYGVYAGTVMKLHPTGQYAYGADRGLSPSDIEKYDLTAGVAKYLYDSPYHGDYGMCGDLWFDTSGEKIFTACGNVFRSSTDKARDMRYIGKINTKRIKSVADSSSSKQLYYINKPLLWDNSSANDDNQLHIANNETFTHKNTYELPQYKVGDSQYQVKGQFVFAKKEGHFVLGAVEPTAGLLNNWGIVSQKYQLNKSDVVSIKGQLSAPINSLIKLEAVLSNADEQALKQYSWKIISAPEGFSGALEGQFSKAVSFNANFAGIYKIIVVAWDENGYSQADTININVVDPTASYSMSMPYNPVDSAFVAATNKLIYVSADPNKLVVFDPSTLDHKEVELSLSPTALTVNKYGTKAVVGHNGKLSYVDLTDLSIKSLITVSSPVFDVVMTNGHAYVMPSSGQWTNIKSVNLDSGEEVNNTSFKGVSQNTVMKLHPNGNFAYGANRYTSPDDIEKYDFSSPVAKYIKDSPYHGEYSMCGDLWLSEDGLRIYTACGNIFRASSDDNLDMKYNGTLSEKPRINSLAHSSEAGTVALLTKDGFLQYYNYSDSVLKSKSVLPKISIDDQAYSSEGKFIFFNDRGDKEIMILEAKDSKRKNTHFIFVK